MTILNFFKKKQSEPKLLMESRSPVCPLKVIIEECNKSTYMYLLHIVDNNESIAFKGSCWLCNHGPAPSDLDIKAMQNGLPSMLPAEFCKYPNGIDSLNPEEVEVVWFEEGDGVAVLYQGDILGIIPSWARDTFPVFASGCIKESQLVLSLIKEENALYDRVLKAKHFWDNFSDDFWINFKDSCLSALESQFGPHVKYYAIDGGCFPPKALVKFEVENVTYLVTVGLSMIPQPMVEMCTDTPESKRRIEIALAIETETFNQNAEGILNYLSAQSTIPWQNLSWLGHGHTISANVFAQKFPNVICVGANECIDLPRIQLPSLNDDQTNVLWLMPITGENKEKIEEIGIDAFCQQHITKNKSFWIVS